MEPKRLGRSNGYALDSRPSNRGRGMGGRLIPQRARRQLVPVEAAEARRGGQLQGGCEDAGAGSWGGYARL
jgi:hypothetical protein